MRGHNICFRLEIRKKLSLNYLQYTLLSEALFSTLSLSALFLQIITSIILLSLLALPSYFAATFFIFFIYIIRAISPHLDLHS